MKQKRKAAAVGTIVIESLPSMEQRRRTKSTQDGLYYSPTRSCKRSVVMRKTPKMEAQQRPRPSVPSGLLSPDHGNGQTREQTEDARTDLQRYTRNVEQTAKIIEENRSMKVLRTKLAGI